LREELSLKVFENRVLRRIFGPKRDELTGEWRELHNEDNFNGSTVNFYFSTIMYQQMHLRVIKIFIYY
jgi:hypothetical protein